MARIPDAYSLGSRPGIEVQQAVRPDRSALIVADAVEDLGAASTRAAVVLQDREDQFSYASAKSALLQADIEARRALENDNDWQTFETRYREAMGKAREKATGAIRSNRDRRSFEMESNLALERGAAEIRGIARGKEVDWGRATLEGALANNRVAALNAKDEGSRAALVKASQEMIDGAIAKGYVKQEEAETVRRTWAANYGEGVVDMLPPEQQVAILKKPQGTPADFIDPAKRAQMLKQAEERVRIEEDRRVNRELALEAKADAAKQRAQRNAADEAWKVIAAGGNSADIPRAIWNGLDGRDQMAIINDEKARIDGGKTPTDWNRYYELKQMARENPEGFRNLSLTQDFDKLGPAERKELINLQQSAPGSVDDLDAVGLSKQVELATVEWKDKEKKGLFERRVNETINARNKELGRKLNQAERQQVIDDLLIEGEVRDGGLWNTSRQRFELSPEQTTQFVPKDLEAEFDTIPEQDKAQIKQALAAKKLPQTPENVLMVYRASKAQ